MACDEGLAQRIRVAIGDLSEQRMFGGLAFLIGGHMSVWVSGQGGLMVRLAPEDATRALAEPGARPFEMRGRPLRGLVFYPLPSDDREQVPGAPIRPRRGRTHRA